jgi:hypothetical protein
MVNEAAIERIIHSRDFPSANSDVATFETKKIVSNMQRAMRSWLKALVIFGVRKRNMATLFPTHPRMIIIVETMPWIQNFHASRT